MTDSDPFRQRPVCSSEFVDLVAGVAHLFQDPGQLPLGFVLGLVAAYGLQARPRDVSGSPTAAVTAVYRIRTSFPSTRMHAARVLCLQGCMLGRQATLTGRLTCVINRLKGDQGLK